MSYVPGRQASRGERHRLGERGLRGTEGSRAGLRRVHRGPKTPTRSSCTTTVGARLWRPLPQQIRGPEGPQGRPCRFGVHLLKPPPRAGGGVWEEGREAAGITQVQAPGLPRCSRLRGERGPRRPGCLASALESPWAGPALRSHRLSATGPTLCDGEPPASPVSPLPFSLQSAFLLTPPLRALFFVLFILKKRR